MIMKKLLIVILPIVCNSAFTTDTNTSYNMNRIWDDFDEAYEAVFGKKSNAIYDSVIQNNNTKITQQNIQNNTQQQLEEIQKDINKLNINNDK